MFSKLLGFSFATCLLLLVNRNEAQYALATFYGGNNITGGVAAGNGYVIVNVNISGLAADDYSAIGGSSCFAGGMSYHIHELWEYNTSYDRIGGTECGSAYTGGHWDPWLGCGGATGNSYCASKTGCVDGSSVLGSQGYACNSSNFYDNPYACEVGDWSGKYGKLYVNGTGTIIGGGYSAYEVNGGDLSNLSVVFHCNDGSRAFCAKFENNTSLNLTYERPTQGGGLSGKVAYLPQSDAYGMAYDGTNIGYFYPSSYNVSSDCGNLLYRIFDDWDSNMTYLSGHGNCSAAVGYFYDPTVSCAYGSGSTYCTDMMYLCNDTSYSYECDYSEPESRFLCAPGDLSGKFGSLNPNASNVTIYEMDDFMIDLSLVDGNKSLVLQCENTYEIIACGQFMFASETTAPPNTTMSMSSTMDTTMGDDDTSTTMGDDDTTTTGDGDDDDDTTTTGESIDSDNGFNTSVQFFTTILVATITIIKIIV